MSARCQDLFFFRESNFGTEVPHIISLPRGPHFLSTALAVAPPLSNSRPSLIPVIKPRGELQQNYPNQFMDGAGFILRHGLVIHRKFKFTSIPLECVESNRHFSACYSNKISDSDVAYCFPAYAILSMAKRCKLSKTVYQVKLLCPKF